MNRVEWGKWRKEQAKFEERFINHVVKEYLQGEEFTNIPAFFKNLFKEVNKGRRVYFKLKGLDYVALSKDTKNKIQEKLLNIYEFRTLRGKVYKNFAEEILRIYRYRTCGVVKDYVRGKRNNY